jgi:uncharacterized membrane-anchored protein
MTSQAQALNVSHSSATRSLFIKVPEITAFFWIIKVLSTTVGETFADFLNSNLGLGLTGTSLVMTAGLVGILIVQFKMSRYVPSTYWGSVVLMSVAGTLLTDNLTDNLGVSLMISSAVFFVLLCIAFILWQRTENTLSIHSIDTNRREAFYWAVILLTFALGTATGDLVAERFSIGYGNSFLLFAGLIALISFAWKAKLLGSIASFWFTYILTRPLGASLGDFLSQDRKIGGVGLGTTKTSLIFLSVILALVVYLTITKKDQIKKAF